ncbi:hypothetical protein F4805DRAFT_289369 [Annulohypoxylon moriforme]|nr:hypothetical protein F4805DRAFT_289369 [Annulohypoxylon moriforme]
MFNMGKPTIGFLLSGLKCCYLILQCCDSFPSSAASPLIMSSIFDTFIKQPRHPCSSYEQPCLLVYQRRGPIINHSNPPSWKGDAYKLQLSWIPNVPLGTSWVAYI